MAFFYEENGRNCNCRKFCDDYAAPESVKCVETHKLKEIRNENYTAAFKYESTQNEIVAEIRPLLSAVKNDEPKILIPDSIKEIE